MCYQVMNSFVHSVQRQSQPVQLPVCSPQPPFCCPQTSRPSAAQDISTYIQQQERLHKQLAERPGEASAALLKFIETMRALSSDPNKRINQIHISAIFLSAARIRRAAPKRDRNVPSFPKPSQQQAHAFLRDMLQLLQPMVHKLGATEVSNILWSSVKLELSPDSVAPGLVDKLLNSFLLALRACKGGHLEPKTIANVVWALATLGHQPADDAVLEMCCARFLSLISSSANNRKPISHEIGNLLWGLGKLKVESVEGHVLSVFCAHFMDLINSSDALRRPTPVETSNFLWGLGRLNLMSVDAAFLDLCCEHFHTRTVSADTTEQPNAQSVAMLLWALKELKHAPKDGVVLSLADRLVSLTTVPRQQPTAQDITNVMFASANLGVGLTQDSVDALVACMLGEGRDIIQHQNICNTLWSLAVMNTLKPETCKRLIDRLFDSNSGAPIRLPSVELSQLHQALDWLEPSPAADLEDQRAWEQLQAQAARLGPRPPGRAYQHAPESMLAALTKLRLNFKARVVKSNYQVEAELVPVTETAPSVLLSLQKPQCFNNMPDR